MVKTRKGTGSTELAISEAGSAKKKRALAVGSMNPELRKLFTVLEKEVLQLGNVIVMGRHRIGQRVSAVIGSERTYGEGAVETLAAALNCTPSALYEYRRIAESYTTEEIKRMLALRTAGGNCLSYNHFNLISPTEGAERKALITRIIEEDLSVDQLALIIQDKHGGKRSRGGRKPQSPKTISAGLHQLNKFSEDVGKRMGIWDVAIFDRMVKGPSDDLDEKLLKSVHNTQTELQTLLSNVNVMMDKLHKAEQRVRKVVQGDTSSSSNGRTRQAPRTVKKKVLKKAVKRKIPKKVVKEKVARKGRVSKSSLKKKPGTAKERLAAAKKKKTAAA